MDIYLKRDGVGLAVGCLLIFSDKSRTSLKSGSFFYPLHETLLNFSGNHRRSRIVSGRAIFAYLPVEYQRIDKLSSATCGASGVRNRHSKVLSRTEILQTLHLSVSLSLEALIEVAVNWHESRNSYGKESLFTSP